MSIALQEVVQHTFNTRRRIHHTAGGCYKTQLFPHTKSQADKNTYI